MAVKSEGMFTYHIRQDRERKNLAILELIRRRSPISKAEISRTLGYNIVTITNYLDYYIDKKMVLEVGLDISSGGRRPELLELNAKSGYVVGVDVGPESISAIVADIRVKMLSRARIARPEASMEDLVGDVVRVMDEAIVKSGVDRAAIKSVGIGVSGIVDYNSGTIRDTDPVRGRSKVSLVKFAKAIEQKFGVPVFVGNDASCAAFGEKAFNPGGDVDNLVFIYSDVGCGIVINGDVYIGASGCSGETQIVFDDARAGNGKYRDAYAFMRPCGIDLGVVAAAKKAIEKGEATDILKLAGGKAGAITMDNVIDAAKDKDKLAVGLISSAGRDMGVRVAYTVNFLNPAVAVIGGGMERAGDIFMDPLKESVKAFAFEEPVDAVKIVPSMLGDNAVATGAAALAAREVFIQA